jgi:hypothetical protein
MVAKEQSLPWERVEGKRNFLLLEGMKIEEQ